jgi:peptidylprolyl isomerase
MAVGERAELTCRADYAYGDAGSEPDIPPGATLVFTLTLLSVRPPRGGAKADAEAAAAELARVRLEREEKSSAPALTSTQRREAAAAAAKERLASKGKGKR